MSSSSKLRFLEKLLCPECQQGVLVDTFADNLECATCGRAFPIIEGLPFLFTAADLPDYIDRDQKSGKNARNREGKNHGGAYHWKEYHIQEFLPPLSVARDVLLLGCGNATEVPELREMGFETVSFDVRRSPGTDFLADAHRLPLRDQSFDLVLSMQVLEHLHAPWVTAKEIARVLRPGGSFVGSVAFLKPYHNSYFHMTHKGVTHLLDSHGLKIDKLLGAQSLTYTLYGSLLPIGTRSVKRKVYGSVDWLISRLRSTLWSTIRRRDPYQLSDRFDSTIPMSFSAFEKLRFAPAIVFRAQKELHH